MNGSSNISNLDPFDVLFQGTSPRGKPIFQERRPSPVNVDNSFAASCSIDTPSSAGSEFGSFVSVSADSHPLRPSCNEKNPEDDQLINFLAESTPSTSYFDNFAKEATERTKRNEQRVLDDLRADEEDPLGWLHVSGSGAISSSPSQKETFLGPSSNTPLTQEQIMGFENMEISPPEAGKPLVGLAGSSESMNALKPPTQSIPRTTSDTAIHQTHQSRARSRSPPPGNLSFGSSLSRSWMSSLLTSTRASPARTSSPRSSPALISRSPSIEGDSEGTPTQSTPMSPTETRLHELFAKSQHAKTLPPTNPVSTVRRAQRQSISIDGFAPHHSPFASHPFIPPSGAPGFSGDHEWNTAGFEYDTHRKLKPVRLTGRKGLTVPVLDDELANSLRPFLPALARLPDTWTLLYSLDEHGISLNTLYTRCMIPLGLKSPGSAGTLLIAQDAEAGVFGAWISEGIHLSHGAYYGGGDSFLWSRKSRHTDSLKIFKWTGRNNFVALCETDSISFGGGDGHYGLYIDASLIEGTSHRCPTFDNDTLAQGERKGEMISFDCAGLEVWGVGP